MALPSFPFSFGKTPRSLCRIEHDGLLNQVAGAIKRCKDDHVAVMMVNLRYSNRLGIITGTISAETISRYATQRIERILRKTDRYCQISNDQVCVVLPDLAEPAQSILAAHKILAALREPFGLDEQVVWLSPYAGIANYPEQGRSASDLIMFADMAARIASETADGYHVHQAESSGEAEVYRGLDMELAAAIRGNELNVHYQPQIEIATGRCVSAEALLRWKAVSDKHVTPPTIIAMAESTGLLESFTQWLLNTTFRNTVEFARAGVPINVSINLSAKTLGDEEFPELVQQAIGIWGVQPSRITFEITESSTIGDPERALLMLKRLHGLGVHLSLDDFGTGYSSLAYLKQYPLHELKIDQLFVRNMRDSAGDRAIVRTVVDLAHNFGLLAVAEGVEDIETLAELGKYGCDLAQGYLFSRAIGYQEFVDWYRARSATGHAARTG